MLKRSGFVVLLLAIGTLALAQDGPLKRAKTKQEIDPLAEKKAEQAKKDSILKKEYELHGLNAAKPTIGLGTGLLSFYGEVSNKKFADFKTSRPAYELSLAQNLNDYLNLKFYVLFGKLGANERSPGRNLNFQSEIRLGGANITYNFDHLLPPQRNITPFIFTGIETFEFLSKSDLADRNGDLYYYWADGSIHNLPENSPQAAQSKVLVRDYTYESDLREANLDGLGKYRERSMSIPVGAGITMKINDRVDFKIATAVHFTQTDYIDNVCAAGQGVRQGDKKKDRFVMTCFSLNYDLVGPSKKEEPKMEKDSADNYLALDTDDEDGDGVSDPKDMSPFTPKGVAVDTSGVPLDEDGDLAFDYLDQEKGSAQGALTNTKGVTYTEKMMEEEWLHYIDSTGEYAFKVNLNDPLDVEASKDPKRRIISYSVFIGQFKNKVPTELINKYLSITDIVVVKDPKDTSNIYLAGKYSTYDEAMARKAKIRDLGIPDAVVVFKNRKGEYLKATAPVNEGEEDESKYLYNFTVKNNANSNVVNNTVKNNNKTNNNTNSNNSNKNNANNNNSNSNNTNNNNNSNNNANNNVANNNNNTNVDTTVKDMYVPSASSENVTYRVQVGAYKNKVATNNLFSNVPNLFTLTGDDNVTRYLSGSFKSYKDALSWKYDLYVLGYKDAFVTAFKEGQRVTLQSTGVALEEEPDNSNGYPFVSDPKEKDIDKKAVVFKVQLGSFQEAVPNELLQKYLGLGKVSQEVTPENSEIRYTVGNYNSYEQAEAKLKDVEGKGITGATIIAFYNDRMIDVKQARELLK